MKHKDDVAPQLAELDRLLELPITGAQRKAIENEIWLVRAGLKGEREAAYHIDFTRKEGKNSVVLHDLRLDYKGQVAQIDHLILTRTLECYVLESKNFGAEVRINTAGEWEVRSKWGWKGMASPVEQNRRHIQVLRSFIEDHDLAPRRLGLALPIVYHNWVLVAPGCQLKRRKGELEQVVKMDLFQAKLEQKLEAEGALWVLSRAAKWVSLETIEGIGRALMAAHRPAAINYAARFGVQETQVAPPLSSSLPTAPEPHHCENCGLTVETPAGQSSRLNAQKVGGRVLCSKCQKVRDPVGCDGCGAALEAKVIAFCRFNSRRFGGRKLCRECQRTPVPA